MKTRPHAQHAQYQPSEDAIREKALELYISSGWIHGRDLDNWLEAEAYLIANPPTGAKPHVVHQPGTNVHHRHEVAHATT